MFDTAKAAQGSGFVFGEAGGEERVHPRATFV